MDASTLDIDTSGAFTLDSSTFSIDSANGPSNITTTATDVNQDFTISLLGQHSSKLSIISERQELVLVIVVLIYFHHKVD